MLVVNVSANHSHVNTGYILYRTFNKKFHINLETYKQNIETTSGEGST